MREDIDFSGIDIDRLRAIFPHRHDMSPRYRCSGKTLSSCFELAHVIDMNSNNCPVVCIIKKIRDLDYILPLLSDVLKRFGFSIDERVGRMFFRIGYRPVRFVCLFRAMEEGFFGLTEAFVVDFVDY
jgi:hypothetical protein